MILLHVKRGSSNFTFHGSSVLILRSLRGEVSPLTTIAFITGSKLSEQLRESDCEVPDFMANGSTWSAAT